MASNHAFSESDGLPTWTGTYWRITLQSGQVIAEEIADDNPIEAGVAAETMRSIVADILSGSKQYAHELTTLVLAAELYRKDNP
ncbi:hypothetical protein [Mycolicibacterium sp.]|uniref:hypothetical protein n=1 Tax=Mycolicibacterium sp. TaxID=2320850 RepID=UPI00355DB61C